MNILTKHRKIFKSIFDQFGSSSEYFRLKFKWLLRVYSRLLRRRHYIIDSDWRRRAGRLVIVRNVLRQKGGFVQKRKLRACAIHGVAIPVARKSPKRKRRRRLFKGRGLLTQVTIEEAASKSPTTEADVIVIIEAPQPEQVSNISVKSKDELNSSCEETYTENIWNLSLEKVAAQIADEPGAACEPIKLHCNGNGKQNDSFSADIRSSKRVSLFAGVENGGEPARSSTPVSPMAKNAPQIVANGFATPPKGSISDRLREQLKLLKMGKPIAAPAAPRIDQCRKIMMRRNTISTALPLQKPSITLDGLKAPFSPIKNGLHQSPPAAKSSTGSLNASATDGTRKRVSGGVIESLFKRLKSFESDTPASENGAKRPAAEQIGIEPNALKPPVSPIRLRKISAAIQPAIDSQDDSCHSTGSGADFVGFESISKTANISSLMPTPRVERSSKKSSVFISEELDAFMKENALDNAARIEIRMPPKMVDEAMITEDAQPPNMSFPERPNNMQKPRTLAEKRLILQRQNDIRQLMIEHESTVYHELRKRVKQGTAYSNGALKTIQDIQIPFTRDCWRVTSWINTQNNHFFYQTIRWDGDELKLTGGRGNNEHKLLCELSDERKMDIKMGTCCRGEVCKPLDEVRINNYEDFVRDIEQRNVVAAIKSEPITRKLSSIKADYVKPSPLSKKVKNRRSLDIEFSQVEILELPKVQLEVWPEVGQPLPESIKPILKTVVGEDCIISPMWASFAVSVVQQKNPPVHKHRRKYKRPSPERKPSYVFDIPYVNNQTKILVRRRRKPTNQHGIVESVAELDKEPRFKRNVDPSDSVAVECANVLADLIHSVAVTLNENNFIHNDPDIDYVGRIVPIESLTVDVRPSEQVNKDKQQAKLECAAKSKIM